MLSILDRYISQRILHSIMMTLFILVSLSSIIKFIEQLRKVGQGSYSILGAGLFTFLSIPKDIEIFFPMIVLLGVLLGLSTLSNCNELIVIQTSGLSRLQIASIVMKTAIPLVFMNIVIGEWVVPMSEKLAYNYRTKMIYGSQTYSIQNGVWAKDDNDFVFIENVLSYNELAGINIYHFDKNERLQSICYAATASFIKKSWKLSQVTISFLTDVQQIHKQVILSDEWKTTLTPNRLDIIASNPNSLSILRLHDYIKYLKQSKQEFKHYQLNMWSKIFSPFSLAVMILMALSFIFGPLDSISMGGRVVTGIIFGFFFTC